MSETMKLTLINKNYTSEELCDIGRDISESFNPDFNEQAKHIKNDDHGFSKGLYIVSIEYVEDDE